MAAKVRRDKNGIYWVVVHSQGRRKKKRVGPDKRAAEKVARELQARLILGQLDLSGPEERQIKFEEFANRWLRTEVELPRERGLRGALAPNTIRNRKIFIRNHLCPFFGQLDIREIRAADIQRFYEQCLENGRPRSRATLDTILGTLRQILGHAQMQELVQVNAVEVWKTGRGRSRGAGLQPVDPSKVLTADELDRLLAATRQRLPASFSLVLFLADTGCRIGEAIGLQWADVDLAGGTVRIERSVDHRGRVGPTKTRRSRTVELSTRLGRTLTGIRPDLFGDATPVFSNSQGDVMNSANFRQREFKKLVRAAFGPGRRLTPHSLRHTWASLHLARGSNLKWIQETGGWSSAKMLLDVYGHYLVSESSGYADALTPVNGPYTAPGQAATAHAAATTRGSFRSSEGKMEPTIRLERTTCSLRVSCSTN